MKPLKFLRNSAGISMVEVMMAVSVMGGLSLTVAQLMKNTSENTKQNEAKQENVNLKGLIQNNLSVPQACKNTFNALITQTNLAAMTGTGTVAVPNIRNKVGTGTIMYSSSTNLQPLSITSMVLTNYVAAAGTADLVVNSTFKKSTNNIVMVKPIKIPINFNIDNTVPASPVLVNCSSMAVSGGEWMLGGNAGTVDGTDYLGTSDAQPLNFKVNNRKAGRIDSTGRLLAYGYEAANSASSYISGTTAIGHRALFSSINNDFNTAVGFEALYTSTTGQSNTAVGAYALKSNNRGGSTALGHNALATSTSGQSNVAIGVSALFQNITGSGNTAVGTLSLVRNLGSQNVALGQNTGSYNTNGSFNTYIGYGAGLTHGTGSNNIFLGNSAGTGVGNASNRLYIETTGNTTPLIGGDFSARSLDFATSGGTNFKGIGFGGKGVSISPSYGNVVTPPTFAPSGNSESAEILRVGGALRISGFYTGAASQSLFFGNPGANDGEIRWYDGPKYWEIATPSRTSALVITDGGDVAFGGWPDGVSMNRMSFFPTTGTAYKELGGSWTAISDRRLKKNIKNLDGALDKISKLRPVSYGWKNEHLHSIPNGDIGFIAQEVEKVFPGWVGETETKSDDRLLLPKGAKVKNVTLPIGFDAYLVKAIQELNEQVIKNQEMFHVMHNGLEEQVKENTKAIVVLEEEVKNLKLENKQLRDRLKRIEKALNLN